MISFSSVTNSNFSKIVSSLILANFSSLYFVRATKVKVQSLYFKFQKDYQNNYSKNTKFVF